MTSTSATQRYNVLAIIGFILSFFGFLAIVGLILDIVAKNQIKRTGERGGGLATAGIIIAIVVIVISIASYSVALPMMLHR